MRTPKRTLTLCLTALLALSCFALASCSAGGESAASTRTITEPDDAAVAERTALFAGEWKLAAMKMDDLTMSGNFGQVLGAEDGSTITLNEDGSGSFMLSGAESTVSWQTTGQYAARIIVANEESSGELNAIYKDGVISVKMQSDQASSSTLLYTRDGTTELAPGVSAANAEPITSMDQLVGSWQLVGETMNGLSVTGSPQALGGFMGQNEPVVMVIAEDGATELMGDKTVVSVSEEGALLETGLEPIQVKSLGDDIVFDASELFGVDAVLLFSR